MNTHTHPASLSSPTKLSSPLKQTWHILIAVVFVFLSTMFSAIAIRGQSPALSGTLSAVFLAAALISGFAGYGLHVGKRWAVTLSHTLTAIIGGGSLAIILMPHYAPDIAPRASVPFCAVMILTSIAFLVSASLAIKTKQDRP